MQKAIHNRCKLLDKKTNPILMGFSNDFQLLNICSLFHNEKKRFKTFDLDMEMSEFIKECFGQHTF